MSLAIASMLATSFGKPLAERLVKGLQSRQDGNQRLAQASAAMEQGLSAIEALKKVFGRDLLPALNEAMGVSSSSFAYEAGTTGYIIVDQEGIPPVRQLRDELNINLDRLSVMKATNVAVKNHFMGLAQHWRERCEHHFGSSHRQDIEATFNTIQKLMKGESYNYRQIYELLKTTGLGGAGALMLISGVFVATGTGVGVAASISMFLFGIPWLTVGGLVIPGALLLVLGTKKARPSDEISLSVALAYKLLDRIAGPQTSN